MKKACVIFFALLLILAFPLCVSASGKSVYRSVATEEKVIALTFDDGPHPRYTPQILDILAEHDAKATFFVIGKNIELYGSAAIRAAREGHELGNHTYSHRHLANLTPQELEEEIVKNSAVIQEKIGVVPRLFRPPEGFCTQTVRDIAESDAYPLVLWTVDTRDWSGVSAAKIVETVLKEARPGQIVLFHDYVAKNSQTPAALKEILPRLSAAGYRFVTVSELLEYAK